MTDTTKQIAGVDVERLMRNLDETSYNEGAIDLAARLSDCKAVIEELLAARATPASPAPAPNRGAELAGMFAWPETLHPDTMTLVMRFANALASKLAAAEVKYGYTNRWQETGWMDECRQKLIEHMAKGDPRDVAAYCSFLWHHNEPTAPVPAPATVPEGMREDANRYRLLKRNCFHKTVNGFDGQVLQWTMTIPASEAEHDNLDPAVDDAQNFYGDEPVYPRATQAERKPQPAAQAAVPEGWALAIAEVEKATRKFPTWPTDPLHAVAVLGEEFGELTKAVLQTTYEPHKVQDGELRTEAIQTAAMALRFLASLDRYEFTRCEQHAQGAPTEPQTCTCPSGDGSLRWPCPTHPPAAQECASRAHEA